MLLQCYLWRSRTPVQGYFVFIPCIPTPRACFKAKRAYKYKEGTTLKQEYSLKSLLVVLFKLLIGLYLVET